MITTSHCPLWIAASSDALIQVSPSVSREITHALLRIFCAAMRRRLSAWVTTLNSHHPEFQANGDRRSYPFGEKLAAESPVFDFARRSIARPTAP